MNEYMLDNGTATGWFSFRSDNDKAAVRRAAEFTNGRDGYTLFRLHPDGAAGKPIPLPSDPPLRLDTWVPAS